MSQMLSPAFLPAPLGGAWGASADVPALFARDAESYAKHWRAPSTVARRYSSWKKILGLCVDADACPLPMSVGTAIGVVAHVAASGVSLGDVRAVRDAIAFVHSNLGHVDPTKHVRFGAVFGGIKRQLGNLHSFREIALTRAEVGGMIDVAYARRRPDHAVALAVAFEGALRVSELCALEVADVRRAGDRVRLFIRKSKTDQNGSGAFVNLELRENAPFDAGAMTLRWLDRIGRKSGFVLSPLRARGVSDDPLDERTFTRMVKFYAACIGLDPRDVGSHSMRAGWITEEIDLGRPAMQVAAHARHGSPDMLLCYYRTRREARNFVAYASAGCF